MMNSEDYYDGSDDIEAEEETDLILKAVWEKIIEEETGVRLLDPERMREFLACGEAMKSAFSGSGARMKISPHDTFSSTGSIVITMDRLCIKKPDLFFRALSRASNYEIYPKINGELVLAITFYGLTV